MGFSRACGSAFVTGSKALSSSTDFTGASVMVVSPCSFVF